MWITIHVAYFLQNTLLLPETTFISVSCRLLSIHYVFVSNLTFILEILGGLFIDATFTTIFY